MNTNTIVERYDIFRGNKNNEISLNYKLKLMKIFGRVDVECISPDFYIFKKDMLVHYSKKRIYVYDDTKDKKVIRVIDSKTKELIISFEFTKQTLLKNYIIFKSKSSHLKFVMVTFQENDLKEFLDIIPLYAKNVNKITLGGNLKYLVVESSLIKESVYDKLMKY